MEAHYPWLITGAACGAAGMATLPFLNPRSEMFAPVIRSLSIINAVALTFDDGPSEAFTPRILDLLGEHKVQASFFVIGANVRKYPALARRITEEGHTIANHSWSHERLGIARGAKYWNAQLARTNRVIRDNTGKRARLFRPPRGFKSPWMGRALRRRAMRVVGWRLRAFDTAFQSPDIIAGWMTRHMRGGDIITLHDGLEEARTAKSQQGTVDALPRILAFIRQRSWACLSLEQGLDTAVYQPVRPS